FLSLGANDARGLRSMGSGNWRDTWGTILDRGGQGDKGFFVEVLGVGAGGVARNAHAVIDRHDQVFFILCRSGVVFQVEGVAGGDATRVSDAPYLFLDALQLLQPYPRILLAMIGLLKAALPFEHFQIAVLRSATTLGN